MSTENAPSAAARMAEHPDILELTERYERFAETPTAQAVDGLVTLAGIYVAASAWIVGFDGFRTLTVNNLIVGLAIAVLGIGFASAYERTHRISWVCPLLGVWTIVSVWVVSGSVATTASILSNVISGAVVTLLGLAAMTPMLTQRQRARP